MSDQHTIARHFVRCFHTPAGQEVLAYLSTLTSARALGPEASDALLRHLEGQRFLMAHIRHLIDAGQKE